MRPLYNNYVLQPVGNFVVQVLVLFMATATWGYMFVGVILDCIVPEKLQTQEVKLVTYEFINNSIAISTENEGYLIYQDAIDDHEELFRKIKQRESFFVSFQAGDDHARPILWELRSEDGDIDVLTSDVEAAAKKSAGSFCVISTMVLGVIWGFFIGSTYVLYNAPRYPRLAKLLIREEFRNF